MIGQHYTDYHYQDIQLPRIRRDESDVQFLMQLTEKKLVGSFHPEQEELVSLSTAAEVPP